MEKENMVSIRNEMSLSHRKEWNSVIFGNMDESGGCYEIGQKDKYVCSHSYVEAKKLIL